MNKSNPRTWVMIILFKFLSYFTYIHKHVLWPLYEKFGSQFIGMNEKLTSIYHNYVQNSMWENLVTFTLRISVTLDPLNVREFDFPTQFILWKWKKKIKNLGLFLEFFCISFFYEWMKKGENFFFFIFFSLHFIWFLSPPVKFESPNEWKWKYVRKCRSQINLQQQ